jgi:hypothetical protein
MNGQVYTRCTGHACQQPTTYEWASPGAPAQMAVILVALVLLVTWWIGMERFVRNLQRMDKS